MKTKLIWIRLIENLKVSDMEKKTCTKCLEEKELSEFHFRSGSKVKPQSHCKSCCSERKKAHYKENKEIISEKARSYYSENKEKVSRTQKTYYENNSEYVKAKNKEWFEANKEYMLKTQKDYREVNKEKIKAKKKEYYIKNKDSIIKKNILDVKERYKTDPLYRISRNIRCLILQSLRKNGLNKKSKTYEIIGCTFEELAAHLESNPYGFKISDTSLDIDHIIPLSTAISEEGVLKLNHYTNLQLLPSLYNRNIKSNKQFDKEHFEDWLKQQSLG